jgi:phospholipase/lecithinase/hemolysin
MTALISMVSLAFCLTAVRSYSFTALYAFGDSLTDTGRDPAPAGSYYAGRFSNGPLWVEYLSAQLGLPYNAANNFAVSGSQTSDLLSQIAGLTASTNLHSGLFTVLSGGNDFLQNAGVGVDDAAWSTIISNAVVNVTNAIGQLYLDGAREILLGNLPNLGETPVVRSFPGGFSAYVDSKVALFNSQLMAGATSLMQQRPALRIYLLDNNALFNSVLSAPAAYGFTVITNDALHDSNLTDKSFNGPGANYAFWDPIHPTTKLHALIAATGFDQVGVELNLARNGANFTLAASNLYAGFSYTIQSSTNLASWANYNVFTAATTHTSMTVTNGPGGKAYYRMAY